MTYHVTAYSSPVYSYHTIVLHSYYVMLCYAIFLLYHIIFLDHAFYQHLKFPTSQFLLFCLHLGLRSGVQFKTLFFLLSTLLK